jgi:hypothetical protein
VAVERGQFWNSEEGECLQWEAWEPLLINGIEDVIADTSLCGISFVNYSHELYTGSTNSVTNTNPVYSRSINVTI